jgi:VanZ family protein
LLLVLSTKRILRAWLPSAIWLAMIALESTNLGSAENTGRVLYPVFHFLFALDPVRFAFFHEVLRKTGHFVGYFTLSVLLFRSWCRTLVRPDTRWRVGCACLAFVSTVLVASLDEWHQSFLPSRTSLFSDVILDSAAGFAAQIATRFASHIPGMVTKEAVATSVDPAEQFVAFRRSEKCVPGD